MDDERRKYEASHAFSWLPIVHPSKHGFYFRVWALLLDNMLTIFGSGINSELDTSGFEYSLCYFIEPIY